MKGDEGEHGKKRRERDKEQFGDKRGTRQHLKEHKLEQGPRFAAKAQPITRKKTTPWREKDEDREWFERTTIDIQGFYDKKERTHKDLGYTNNQSAYTANDTNIAANGPELTPDIASGRQRTSRKTQRRSDQKNSSDDNLGRRSRGRRPGNHRHRDRHTTAPTMVEGHITVTTTNSGDSMEGLGNRKGAEDGTPLSMVIKELEREEPDIAGIQEHKMGRQDHERMVGLKTSSEWKWIGFPGPKKGKQGLGFFLKKEVQSVHTSYSDAGAHEMATLIAETKGIRCAVINVYWESGCNNAERILNAEALVVAVEEAKEHNPDILFIIGDLNIDMLVQDAKSGSLTALIENRLGTTRIDTIGNNATWKTRIRSKTHLDCIAYEARIATEIQGAWNHKWAGADKTDHTSLGTKIRFRTVKTPTEKKEQPRYEPVRYKYKNFEETDKAKYEHTTQGLNDSGIGERVRAHLALAEEKTHITKETIHNIIAVDTCLIEAAMHTAARKHMKKYRSKGRKSEKQHKRKSVDRIVEKYKERTVWERIQNLTSYRKKGDNENSTQHSILRHKKDGEKVTTETIYGQERVAEQVILHHKKVSEHNLDDPKFDGDLANRVEEATNHIRDKLRAGTLIHGVEHDRPKEIEEDDVDAKLVEKLSTGRIADGEFEHALEKLALAEDGAPSMDGIMAWMILMAGKGLQTTILNLMRLIWEWGVIPDCWKMAIVRYLKKTTSSLNTDISQHRPITLKAILGKLFTRIILTRLKVILEPQIPFNQLGYQSEMDAYTSLWAFRQLLNEQTQRGKNAWVLLCDWAKAYDKVWRAEVLLLINAMGVTGNMWLILDEWIHGTTIVAFFNGTATGPYTVDAGLGQGCVLSALLFLMFIRTLTTEAPQMDKGYRHKKLVEELHSLRLAQGEGVPTCMTKRAMTIQAIVSADDTSLVTESEGGMRGLIKGLKQWKRAHRYESNDKKFHLLATKLRAKKLADATTKYIKQHNKDAAVLLPGLDVATDAEPAAILLGGQLTTRADEDALWSHYVQKVARHQMSLGRILHQEGDGVAREFVRAVVTTPLMAAAAVDTDFVQHGETMDRLQRALWCGGNTSATGLHRSTNNLVSHRIIGELQWSSKLELQRVKAWRRLCHHLKRGSWPGEVANSCQEEAERDLEKGGAIKDDYMRELHSTMGRWDRADGIRGALPVGRKISSTVRIRTAEKALKETPAFDPDAPTREKRQRGKSADTIEPLEGADKLVKRWKESGFSGAALLAATSMRDMEKLAKGRKRTAGGSDQEGGSSSGSDTEEDSSGSERDQTEERKRGEEELREEMMRVPMEEALEARKWEESIEERAHEEQERRWAREQEEYRPADERLGRGEAALWCHLHPTKDHRIARRKWGILHLINFKRSNAEHTDRFIQLLAGSTPTTRAHQCKTRAVKEWRHTADFTDAQRRQAVECPCGKGPQDSKHVLECGRAEIRKIREDVLTKAETLFEGANTPWKMYHLCEQGKDHSGRPTKRRIADRDREKAEKTHQKGVSEWINATPGRKIDICLGASDTDLDNKMRGKIITGCIPQWAKVENAWERINKQV